jgi:alcohol dehydrogenase class IV
MQEAIDFARKKRYDCFLAVGGGSVIDTCKVFHTFKPVIKKSSI